MAGSSFACFDEFDSAVRRESYLVLAVEIVEPRSEYLYHASHMRFFCHN